MTDKKPDWRENKVNLWIIQQNKKGILIDTSKEAMESYMELLKLAEEHLVEDREFVKRITNEAIQFLNEELEEKDKEISRLQAEKKAILVKIEETIFCPNCGKVMIGNDHYCKKCKERVVVPVYIDIEDLKKELKKEARKG